MSFLQPAKAVEYFFAISVSSKAKPSTLSYFTYPTLTDKDEALRNIVPFCFPTNTDDVVLQQKDPCFHDFVLTDERGRKRYLTCMRTKRLKQISTTEDSKQTGDVHYCYCISSTQPRFNLLRNILTSFYMLSMDAKLSQTIKITGEGFMVEIMNQLMLPPSSWMNIRLILPGLLSCSIETPYERNQLPLQDFSLQPLFQSLSVHHIVRIFALLLLEKSVLLHSESLSLLTRSCEALHSILFPLVWDMVYIPIVPEILADLTQAPTPFLMGGHSVWVKKLSTDRMCPENLATGEDDELMQEMQRNEGTFVKFDLDLDEMEVSYYEYTDLAKQLPYRNELIRNLREIFRPDVFKIDGDCKGVKDAEFITIDFDQKTDERIRCVFLQWFGLLFKDFRTFYKNDGRFDGRSWLHSRPNDQQPFCSVFSKTSMFVNFVESRSPIAEKSRIPDIFDQIVDMNSNSAADIGFDSITIPLDETRQKISLTFDLSFQRSECNSLSSTADIMFHCEQFLEMARKPKKEFVTHIVQRLQEEIGKNYGDNYDLRLHWWRAYYLEKGSKLGNNVDAEQIEFALTAYSKALDYALEAIEENTSSVFLGHLDKIVNKMKFLMTKISRDRLEIWQKNAPPRVKTRLQRLIFPTNDQKKKEQTTKPDTKVDRENIPSGSEATDRLILNCNPDISNIHIDSNDNIDEDISEHDLDPELKHFLSVPAILAFQLAHVIVSMLRLVSTPPSGFDSLKPEGHHMTSIDNLKPTPIVDLFKKSKKKAVEEYFILNDASNLKKVKKMPIYDKFKQMVVALRLVKLKEGLKTDMEKLSFWSNVRNVLYIHTLIEFGLPTCNQQKITFTYHKPVYNIAGNLYSINEITHGILKAMAPIPRSLTHGSTGAKPGQEKNLPTSNVSIVHVTTSSRSVAHAADFSISSIQDTYSYVNTNYLESPSPHSGLEQRGLLSAHALQSTQEGQKNNTHFLVGASKLPLKFVQSDPRYTFRLLHLYPEINFLLLDSTRAGARFNVYHPNKMSEYLRTETVTFLNENLECKKTAQTEGPKSEVPFGLRFSGTKKRKIVVPQMINNIIREFHVTSLDQFLLFVYYKYPETKVAKFLEYEDLVRKHEKSSHTKNFTVTEELIAQKISNSHLDLDKLVLSVKEHDFQFQIKIPCDTEDITNDLMD